VDYRVIELHQSDEKTGLKDLPSGAVTVKAKHTQSWFIWVIHDKSYEGPGGSPVPLLF